MSITTVSSHSGPSRALMVCESSPHNYHDSIPLSYVHISANQNGSSSGTSEISSITRLAHAAAATHGSPPTSLGDISYSMFSSSMDDPPVTVATGTPTSSTFRLEPKFGSNTKLRSNPPFWSSSVSTIGVRGRKRTAQSMTLNNSNSAAITRNTLASRTPRQNHHSDNQTPHSAPNGRRITLSMTPPTPRRIEHHAAFNFQGLSLQSPASTTSGTVYNNSTDNRVASNNPYIASPAATHSSFTVCGSSSFSKVNTSFTSASATVDGVSPFRNVRSGSFGSALEHQSHIDGENDGMPPPASIDITASSPRIVPLTVLTRDSLPTTQILKVTSANYRQRKSSFDSSAAGGQPPLPHVVFAVGMSPLRHSVGSSSTSDGCPSSIGPPTLQTPSRKMDDLLFLDNHLTAGTPRRSFPPLTSVQYCPDSTESTMSILYDSPVAAAAAQKKLFFAVKRVNQQSATTIRSGLHPSNIPTGLPSFPSPSSPGYDLRQDRTIVIPNATSRSITSAIQNNRPPAANSLDVSLLSEPHVNGFRNHMSDGNIDKLLVGKGNAASNSSSANQVDKTSSVPFLRRTKFVPRTNTNPQAFSNRDASLMNKVKDSETSNLTMILTPSDVTSVPLTEMIIDMGMNRLTGDSNISAEFDSESLSDGDDDEFFLAAPSAIVEEKRDGLGGESVRQSKQARLHHADMLNEMANGVQNRNHASMTSFGSFNTLLGTGFAMSSTSLRGMDMLSNQHILSSNMSGQNRPSPDCNSTSGTCGVGSVSSIGLDLECPMGKAKHLDRVTFPYGRSERDLITPPVMLESLEPPELSPRYSLTRK